MRSSFSSSTLVRLLGEWTPAEAEPSGLDVAERLSLWVDAFDAIRLQAAHQAIAAVPDAAVPRHGRARPGPAAELADDVQRVRSVLVQAIAQEPGPARELALSPADLRRLARGEAGDGEGAASYAPWGQRHQELQRQMDLMLPPLREHVRSALARGSPRLRQLAALDAAMEQVLAAREQKLLPTLGGRMERRFAALRAEQLQAVQDGAADDPAAWRRPGGWLDRFVRDWRQLLAAELELRLQPVMGLVEAAGKESNEQT